MATYTTQNQPLPWVTPYLQDYMSRAQDVANVPYQQSPGNYVGPNQTLQTAWQATANRALQGSPVQSAANQQLTNTINGGFLNGNPYLDQTISNAQGDLVRSWNTVAKPQWDKAMQQSGSFGNTGVMEYQQNAQNDFMRNLARIGTDMRFGNYTNERQMQQNALAMAPQFAQQDWMNLNALSGVGQQQQAFQQQAQNQNQQWWQEAQQYPQQRLDAYGRALGATGGSGTQTQTAPDPSTASQVVGGALSGAALWKLLFGGP